MVNTKTEICNLALSCIGDKGSVENIDVPEKQTEIVCAKWYDVSRQTALRQMMPSFARKREIWPLAVDYRPAFGYDYAYKYKSNCLKVLGIGEIGRRCRDYAVESGYLLTNEYHENGLPVRYVYDVEDVSQFTPDFVSLFAWFLAKDICIELTENESKYAQIEQILPTKILQYCGVDSQENRPVRISESRLMRARAGLYPLCGRKR